MEVEKSKTRTIPKQGQFQNKDGWRKLTCVLFYARIQNAAKRALLRGGILTRCM